MQLFRFANPEYLYLLLLLPVVILLYIINELRKIRALKLLGDVNLVGRLVPELSKIRPFVKFILQLVALSAGIIMLSRPQFGSKIEGKYVYVTFPDKMDTITRDMSLHSWEEGVIQV
jgi:Ca-activated chloride channel family protein